MKLAGENQLSGKDKKLLKANLSKVVAPDAATHFVERSDKILAKKVQSSKAIIFFESDNPMAIDLSGAGDLAPTLYFALAYPGCLPELVLKQDEALASASIPWEDVKSHSLPPDFHPDTYVVVISPLKEPVAIGTMSASGKD